jgi:hypothetical protein
MHHSGLVLVVTDDRDTADFYTAVLELEGYDTELCSGPGVARDCPRLHGARCSLRERADVAVIDLDCDEDAVSCTQVPDDGSTIFVRRSSTPSPARPDVSRAIEDARAHVQSLHAAPREHQPVMPSELD